MAQNTVLHPCSVEEIVPVVDETIPVAILHHRFAEEIVPVVEEIVPVAVLHQHRSFAEERVPFVEEIVPVADDLLQEGSSEWYDIEFDGLKGEMGREKQTVSDLLGWGRSRFEQGRAKVADDLMQEGISGCYDIELDGLHGETGRKKQTMSDLLGWEGLRFERERDQARMRRVRIHSKSEAMTEWGEDFKEYDTLPLERKDYISAWYRNMDGADIVNMVEEDQKISRRTGTKKTVLMQLISKLPKWFRDGRFKPGNWGKKATIGQATESERQCCSIKKNRPNVEKVGLSCHCERVQHRRGGVGKRIMKACDNLCNKGKPVSGSNSSCSNWPHQKGSEYAGKFGRSFSPSAEKRQTTCKNPAYAKVSKNCGSRMDQVVTSVTNCKTDVSSDFSFFSATFTENNEMLFSSTQSNNVSIKESGIVSDAKQWEEYQGVVFHKMDRESPRHREQKYETFKRLQSYTHTRRNIASRRQQEGDLQLEGIQKTKAAYSMDPQIQKWSHGNEGNLRALLSTLDDALWPECNWKMVPVSQLVTPNSVKKVYRKATFFLHPDKVHQRGGTIEQKYVAEKVFEVLREAWNKFHREEMG